MRARAADVANLFGREFLAQLANLLAEPDFSQVRSADISDDELAGIQIAATARTDLSIPIDHWARKHQVAGAQPRLPVAAKLHVSTELIRRDLPAPAVVAEFDRDVLGADQLNDFAMIRVRL